MEKVIKNEINYKLDKFEILEAVVYWMKEQYGIDTTKMDYDFCIISGARSCTTDTLSITFKNKG